MSTTIGVDVAKSVFEVAVSDRPGRIVKRHRLSRGQFARFLATRAPATVVMEACGMAHFWGRQAVASGHRVVLLPPHAVRPYVPRNKTDRADATALLEAARNAAIHPVPVKSVTQQALTGLHPRQLIRPFLAWVSWPWCAVRFLSPAPAWGPSAEPASSPAGSLSSRSVPVCR